jgi:hypothetical protein
VLSVNPGMQREAWDRTAPDEDWTAVDPPREKPAKRQTETDRLARDVRMFWKTRACWICGGRFCSHREFEVAVAYLTSKLGPPIQFAYLGQDTGPVLPEHLADSSSPRKAPQKAQGVSRDRQAKVR